MSLLRTSRLVAFQHPQFCKVSQPLMMHSRNTYEGNMKSYLTILNQKDPTRKDVNRVYAYSNLGFRLINDTFVYGPMLIFENHVFCWNIRGDDEICEESLQFMFHLHPPLDLIIIGYGDPDNKDIYRRNLHLTARKHNCAIELLPVEKAVGTYNFLVATRNVAGAFVPPAYFQSGRFDNIRNFMDMPDTDDLPNRDEDAEAGNIKMPRYIRVEKQVLVKRKKDSTIETQIKKEDE